MDHTSGFGHRGGWITGAGSVTGGWVGHRDAFRQGVGGYGSGRVGHRGRGWVTGVGRSRSGKGHRGGWITEWEGSQGRVRSQGWVVVVRETETGSCDIGFVRGGLFIKIERFKQGRVTFLVRLGRFGL
jgi:hypothetical protein